MSPRKGWKITRYSFYLCKQIWINQHYTNQTHDFSHEIFYFSFLPGNLVELNHNIFTNLLISCSINNFFCLLTPKCMFLDLKINYSHDFFSILNLNWGWNFCLMHLKCVFFYSFLFHFRFRWRTQSFCQGGGAL